MKIRDLLTEKRLRQLDEMVAEISPQQLRAKLEAGEIFTLIEISRKNDYASGHIPDAIHIKLDELAQEAQRRFKPFHQLVLYSDETSSSASMVAARELQDLGFYNLVVLQGGKDGWREAGFPLKLEDGRTIAAAKKGKT